MVHEVVRRGIVGPHEVHTKQFSNLLDLLQGAPQANHAGMELLDVLLDELAVVTLGVDRYEDRLDLAFGSVLCEADAAVSSSVGL